MENPLIKRGYLNNGYVMGYLNGHKVLVDKGVAKKYGIKKIEHTDEVLIEEPYVVVSVNISNAHTFMVFDKASINPLSQHLSKNTTKLVKVMMKGYVLKGWDRGQVVIGYRSLKFFNNAYSDEDDERSKF